MQRIPLGRAGDYEVFVDDEHFAYLTAWRWTFKRSRGGKIYARRHRRVQGVRQTLLMHAVICELVHGPRPTSEHTADHINRNSLDNRAGNLRWATPSEQSRNRRAFMRRPLWAESDHVEAIPF